MLVSWNWLKDYVSLDVEPEEVEYRLMMAGLNHEGTERVGDDVVIDLEITSNRPDCLGHIGVAREICVLFDRELTVADPRPETGVKKASELTSVAIECPALCRRYTARVIEGVQVKPSPDWLVRRLSAVGIAAINNIVDITNYVLMECGQPLHAFDFAKLAGGRIVVREPKKDEKLEAIDHRTYPLEAGMCVIADAEKPVAIGGVMGGAETEVGEQTKNVLVEAADFAQLAIRNTARKLKLHSPSSYRFERGVDPAGVDWASRRACDLILDLAGGTLAEGVVDAGQQPAKYQPVTLRLDQLERVLGIKIAPEEVRRILAALGFDEQKAGSGEVEVIPPSWRRDVTREIDLVEEVGRIHGYDQIPEDVGVPMVASAHRREDRVLREVRHLLTACGIDEAMTVSATSEATAERFSPWSSEPALTCQTPVLRRADRLRRTLVPSLLESRRHNEALSNDRIELFEIAKVYLPQPGKLPDERKMLAITSGRGFLEIKGVLESLVDHLHVPERLELKSPAMDLLHPTKRGELYLGDRRVGYLGEVAAKGLDSFELRNPATVAEIDIEPLIELAELVPKHTPQSTYPPVSRDLNYVFNDDVRWASVAGAVREAAGDLLEEVAYQETYRDAKRLGDGKKSLLFSITLRSQSDTLTSQQADEVCSRLDSTLRKQLGGEIRS